MKTILIFLFFNLTTLAYGQYSSIPNLRMFEKLAEKYGCDEIQKSNYVIKRIKYPLTFKTGLQSDSEETMDITLYNINDSIILKTYVPQKNKENDYLNIISDKRFSNIFLFPDSTLGIVIYTYDSAFNEGDCGACSEQHFKIYRISQNSLNLVLDYYYSNYNGSLESIMINGMTLYSPWTTEKKSKSFNFLKWDSETIPDVKLTWLVVGNKLKLNFSDFHYNSANMSIELFKKKDNYVFKAY